MIELLSAALLCALVASARADCEACVNGWCHSRKTLVEGFHVTDQLAVDHTHNVLYLQLNSNLNSAFSLNDPKIKLVQLKNTSGMAVDQDTQDLYTADYNGTYYKFKYGTSTPEIVFINNDDKDVNLLFYKHEMLFFTSRYHKRLSFIIHNNASRYYDKTQNISMTDFVVKDYKVYYVADNKVYVIFSKPLIKLISDRFCVLSTDKQGDVYLGDANFKVIYKLDESDKPIEYAAYKTGSVDKFVFDGDNNIVFHDATDGNVIIWNRETTKCKIHAPHTNYVIDEIPAIPEDNKIEALF